MIFKRRKVVSYDNLPYRFPGGFFIVVALLLAYLEVPMWAWYTLWAVMAIVFIFIAYDAITCEKVDIVITKKKKE